MKLSPPLHHGILVKRYKRFLADVRLESGHIVTAHCPNSGSMKGCNFPGSPVVLSESDNPARKLKYTWELIRVNGVWVGINTLRSNRLVEEGIRSGVIGELQGYESLHREVKYGLNSRIDFLLESANGRCYVEVKNVTLVENETALFPDSVTLRGQKHLQELMEMVSRGYRSVVVFVVQREDCQCMAPADAIDPTYGKLLRQAHALGVQLLAYQAKVTPAEITIHRPLRLML